MTDAKTSVRRAGKNFASNTKRMITNNTTNLTTITITNFMSTNYELRERELWSEQRTELFKVII